MNFEELPDICTPYEVASFLKLYKKNGKPNPQAVKKLCVTNQMEYIPVTERNIRIERHAVQEFMEKKKCPVKIKDQDSTEEKRQETGKSFGLNGDSVSGAQQVQLAANLLKKNLQNSSLASQKQKNNVVRMSAE